MILSKSEPKISVIIPVYNSENSIKRAIESIQKQSMRNWELIIIDDGSIDETANICKNLTYYDNRIKYFYQENSGPSAARNKGIMLSNGKYLAFLDADDTYSPEFLERMITALEESEASFSMCGFYKIYETKKLKILPPPAGLSNEIKKIFNVSTIKRATENQYLIADSINFIKLFFYGGPCGISAVWNKVYKKEIFDKFNLRFNVNRDHGEDWELNLRFLDLYNITGVIVNEPLYNYYETEGGLSKKTKIIRGDHKFESAQLMFDINDKYCLNNEILIHKGTAEGFVSYLVGLNKMMKIKEQVPLIKEYLNNKFVKQALDKVWNLPISFKTKVLTTLGKSGMLGLVLFRALCKLR